jgi:hypothetical protein
VPTDDGPVAPGDDRLHEAEPAHAVLQRVEFLVAHSVGVGRIGVQLPDGHHLGEERREGALLGKGRGSGPVVGWGRAVHGGGATRRTDRAVLRSTAVHDLRRLRTFPKVPDDVVEDHPSDSSVPRLSGRRQSLLLGLQESATRGRVTIMIPETNGDQQLVAWGSA